MRSILIAGLVALFSCCSLQAFDLVEEPIDITTTGVIQADVTTTGCQVSWPIVEIYIVIDDSVILPGRVVNTNGWSLVEIPIDVDEVSVIPGRVINTNGCRWSLVEMPIDVDEVSVIPGSVANWPLVEDHIVIEEVVLHEQEARSNAKPEQQHTSGSAECERGSCSITCHFPEATGCYCDKDNRPHCECLEMK